MRIQLVQTWRFFHEIDIKDVWFLDVSDGTSHTVYDHDGAQTDQYDYTDLMPEDYVRSGFRNRFKDLKYPANDDDIDIQMAVRRMTRNLPYALRASIARNSHPSYKILDDEH